jgi:hypothetical protein
MPDQRTLHLVSILHTEADLGSAGKSARLQAARAGALAEWQRRQAAINAMWERIALWASRLAVGPALRIYQDGLPVSGQELRIVEDLAASGSRNHQVVLGLVRRGATLMGTESAELLLREYQLMQSASAGVPDEATRARYVEHARTLLTQRDRAIAQRINETLGPGETGVLFIGALHQPAPLLDPDIVVTDPFGTTPTTPHGSTSPRTADQHAATQGTAS